MIVTRGAIILAGILVGLLPPTAVAEHHGIFVGEYTGMFVPVDREQGRVRDLGVRIREIDGGLNVSWTTTIFDDGESKTKEYSIDFLETEREHIYKAAQKKNLFGGRDPLDPMKGEPFAWARINDRTLSVHVMLITDDGGYEIQTYDRTLKENGDLNTRFSRIRNGQTMRALTATLIRKDWVRQDKNK